MEFTLIFCDLFEQFLSVHTYWTEIFIVFGELRWTQLETPVSAALVCETGSDAWMFRLTSQGSKSSMENSRPVGQVDKHILLLVHGVGNAGES